jgi:phosphoserine phosphatase RsbU/P
LTGLPLGLYDDAKYDEASYTLTAGDILVFYSDGFSESAAPDGQFFGWERMVEAITKYHELSASDMADRLLEEVEQFTARARLSDDRTLVVLKVNPEPKSETVHEN